MYGVAAGHDETDPAPRPRRVVRAKVLRRCPVRRLEPVPVALARMTKRLRSSLPRRRNGVQRSDPPFIGPRTPSGICRGPIPATGRGPSGRRVRTLNCPRLNARTSPVSSPSWVGDEARVDRSGCGRASRASGIDPGRILEVVPRCADSSVDRYGGTGNAGGERGSDEGNGRRDVPGGENAPQTGAARRRSGAPLRRWGASRDGPRAAA